MGRSDSPPSLSPCFVAFARRYHRRAAVRSRRPGRTAGGLGVGDPVPGPDVSVETAGSPRFPGTPRVPWPCSSTPAGPGMPGPCGVPARPPPVTTAEAPARRYFEAQSHGLGTGCLRFAVGVTSPHARLASGCLPSSAGRDSCNPQGSSERFPSSSLFLLSRAFLAQCDL
jgi:hypothetical protein